MPTRSSDTPAPRAARAAERAVVVIGALVATAGAAMLALWAIESPLLAETPFGWPRANEALALCLSGLGLLLLVAGHEDRRAARLGCGLGVVVLAIGALTLLEYAGLLPFSIDELLLDARPETRSLWPPGRMSLSTAFAFVHIGLALALDDRKIYGARPSTVLAALTLHIAFIAGLIYLYRAGPLLGLAAFAAMMPPTLVLVALLSVGLLCLHPQDSWLTVVLEETEGATLARRLLPVAVVVPALLGLLTTRTRLLGLYDAAFETVLQVAGSAAVLVGVIAWNAAQLRRSDLERRRAQAGLEVHAARLRALTDELEVRVQERTRELQAANEELEAFSYSVSHDLRAPLRWVAGFSRALREDYGERLDETGQEYVRSLEEAAQRMTSLVDALLELSRVSRRELATERADVSALATGMLAELAREEPERHVETCVEPGIVVEADARLLRQALENLLRNAWKFTQPKADARIEVTLDDGAIRVADNGVGFDPAFADRLFAPFGRLHAEDAFEGTGIGLALVRRIAHRHGGEVRAEGRPGEGATFWLSLAPAREV